MRSAHPLLLLIIAGCAASSSGDLTDAEQATIRSAVERQVHVFTEGASQLDADLQMSMMAADVEFIDFGRLLSGVDEATEYIRELFANYQTFEFRWDDVEVDVLSRHSALAKARGTLRRQHVDGRIQESNGAMFFTGLLRELDGEWKLTRGHLSGSIRTLPTP